MITPSQMWLNKDKITTGKAALSGSNRKRTFSTMKQSIQNNMDENGNILVLPNRISWTKFKNKKVRSKDWKWSNDICNLNISIREGNELLSTSRCSLSLCLCSDIGWKWAAWWKAALISNAKRFSTELCCQLYDCHGFLPTPSATYQVLLHFPPGLYAMPFCVQYLDAILEFALKLHVQVAWSWQWIRAIFPLV